MVKTLFEQESMTCLDLEKATGLKPGDITGMTIYPGGAVEVETKDTITSEKQTAIRQALESKGLAKNKKPVDIIKK